MYCRDLAGPRPMISEFRTESKGLVELSVVLGPGASVARLQIQDQSLVLAVATLQSLIFPFILDFIPEFAC